MRAGNNRRHNLDKNEIYCELLVIRCQRGDSRAFRELVKIFERRILYYLRRLTDNEQEAWDILQQTWLKVLRGIHSLNDPRRFKSWLYTVARYTASNSLRSRLRERLADDDSALEDIPDTDSDSDAFADADLVHFGLGKLPLEQREIMTLFFLEGFSLAEIAEILGLPDGTVKSRLYRAKQELKMILIQEGGRQ